MPSTAASPQSGSRGVNGNTGDEPAPAPQKNSRTRVILTVVALLALVAAVVWGVHWWTTGRFIEDTDDAYLKADSVTIAPKVSGYVTEVFVQDNQTVTADQPLVRLDTRQYQATLDSAQATIDARRADISKLQADTVQQQANIEQAEAQAQAARLTAKYASDQFNRYAPLGATGAETAERVADLKNTRDQAAATLAANLAAVKAARSQTASMTAQLAQARAQVESAVASLRQARLDLQDTIVRSVQPGRVGDRAVRVGQFVQPGTRLMTVVPTQNVYLVANFKETQLGRMRVGQPAVLHVDALPDVDLRGVVDSFSPGTGSQFALLPAENATGNFTKIVQRVPVRIRIETGPETRKLLLPGLSVTVDVDTKGAREDSRIVEHENQHG